MTTLSISSLSLNAKESQQFLEFLGKQPATTFLRGFFPKGHPKTEGPKPDQGRKHPCWDVLVATKWQQEGRNVYIVINDGGQSDQSISSCRALFCEWDDRPKDWQLTAWRELGLPEPTFQVDSGGRSIHSYWVFADPVEPSLWRDLQVRLLAHTQSDLTLKNLSRVMRVPGCFHLKADGTRALTTIVSQAGTRYSVAELESVLPVLVAVEEKAPSSHQPHSLEEIQEALYCIPAAVPNTGQYGTFRNLTWGVIDACEQAGVGVDEAKELLREHSPLFAELDQVAASACNGVTAGTFWYYAKEAGWKPRPTTTKGAGKGGGRAKENPACRLGPYEVRDLLPQKLGEIRLNVRTRAIHLPGEVLSGNDAARLYLKLSTAEQTWPKETTYDALEYHAYQTPFDPALENLERLVAGVAPLPLEQWRQLDQLLLGIDDPVAAVYLPRYFVAAVARLYQPGCKVDQTPVLIGKQGLLKSELAIALFGKDHFGDQLSTRLDVDDITRLNRFWCLELAELDGITRRSDIEAFKAFLTRTVDVERRKYGRSDEAMPRRTVFWGTSNSSPLRDQTGSRRFVCIPLPDRVLPIERVAGIRAPLWARALEQYRAGLAWWSTPEEAAQIEQRNADHQQTDPWHFEIEAYLRDVVRGYQARQLAGSQLHVTNQHLLDHLEVAKSQQNSGHYRRIGQIMGSLGWEQKRRPIKGSSIHCWVPIE